MQLDNKLKQTGPSLMAEVKREYLALLDERERAMMERIDPPLKKMDGLVSSLEGKLLELRREIETAVNTRLAQ